MGELLTAAWRYKHKINWSVGSGSHRKIKIHKLKYEKSNGSGNKLDIYYIAWDHTRKGRFDENDPPILTYYAGVLWRKSWHFTLQFLKIHEAISRTTQPILGLFALNLKVFFMFFMLTSIWPALKEMVIFFFSFLGRTR